ncbi:MAG: SEC-C domain-containing protein, partial [Candidatus Vogelbacteria bacterium]|nr:SEC-C domain-containing protein [Candidatus Vogelbacteria bacterium]
AEQIENSSSTGSGSRTNVSGKNGEPKSQEVLIPRQLATSNQPLVTDHKKLGRNDPCPCGSGLKWKKCGLISAPEHKMGG